MRPRGGPAAGAGAPARAWRRGSRPPSCPRPGSRRARPAWPTRSRTRPAPPAPAFVPPVRATVSADSLGQPPHRLTLGLSPSGGEGGVRGKPPGLLDPVGNAGARVEEELLQAVG